MQDFNKATYLTTVVDVYCHEHGLSDDFAARLKGALDSFPIDGGSPRGHPHRNVRSMGKMNGWTIIVATNHLISQDGKLYFWRDVPPTEQRQRVPGEELVWPQIDSDPLIKQHFCALLKEVTDKCYPVHEALMREFREDWHKREPEMLKAWHEREARLPFPYGQPPRR